MFAEPRWEIHLEPVGDGYHADIQLNDATARQQVNRLIDAIEKVFTEPAKVSGPANVPAGEMQGRGESRADE
jgi:hypothetical protein